MSPTALAQFVHPYYVASDLSDLDAAFEDGKARAMRVLEKQIRQVQAMARRDYERELFPQCDLFPQRGMAPQKVAA